MWTPFPMRGNVMAPLLHLSCPGRASSAGATSCRFLSIGLGVGSRASQPPVMAQRDRSTCLVTRALDMPVWIPKLGTPDEPSTGLATQSKGGRGFNGWNGNDTDTASVGVGARGYHLRHQEVIPCWSRSRLPCTESGVVTEQIRQLSVPSVRSVFTL